MNIAIAGGGIAGTAVGHLLAFAGHRVTIFEQAQQCTAVGAGIMLQPSGQAVLRRLGIHSQIASTSAPLAGLEARLASGSPLIRLDYASLDRQASAWGVHRGVLFETLLGLCQSSGVEIATGSRVIGFETDDAGVTIEVESGRREGGFDFLIAADGSRSSLREVAALPCRTVEYPYAALWTTGPCESVSDRLFQVIDGTRRLSGLLPIGEGKCSFFWGLRADQYDAIRAAGWDTWRDEVLGLCPQAESVLQSAGSWDGLQFARYRHVGMRRPFGDRIIFLGDAGHASSPHLGQGVNLALEDAAEFADALGESANFESACHLHVARRSRKIRYYQQLTRLLTPFFQSDGRLLGVGRDLCLPWFPRLPWMRRRMLRTLCGTQRGWF